MSKVAGHEYNKRSLVTLMKLLFRPSGQSAASRHFEKIIAFLKKDCLTCRFPSPLFDVQIEREICRIIRPGSALRNLINSEGDNDDESHGFDQGE